MKYMADQQRRVSLIFDADANSAQGKIDALVKSLNKVMDISTRSSGVASLDKDLQKTAQSAALLETQLKNAFNVHTGKLDLTKFNDSLKSSGMNLEKYQASFSKLGRTGEEAFSNLARSIATAEIPLRRTNGLLNDFAVTMKNTVKWQLSSSLMHGFLSSVQSAMSYAQNLNANLNEIRIVTGQSAEEMARFAEQANRSAKELSTTTNQYAQAALIFYQQGLNDKAVKERTDAVIKMANVTGDAAKEVSSYMTAIWNNFDDGSKSIEYYADVITKLGAATAASSAEIAGGLEKFAAVGNTIGLSYEYATAMLTTIIDKTRQSEDVVGTALKTILARIQGLNLGETLDDGTTLNKYSSALASVGVQIKDTSGELRSMDAILNDLGAKWQTLGKDTQVALAQVVGGVRQYNQIISLMDNWDAFEMNVDIAFGAEGELDKQAEIYAESWEASQKRVQAALESIYSSLIDDKFFIGLNDAFATLLKFIKDLIDGFGGLQGVIATLGSVVFTVFGKQIESSLKNLTNNLVMATKTGQNQIIELQKKAQVLLEASAGKNKNTAVANAYKSEAQAQLLLLNNSKKLSEEEQAVANILMQQHRVRVDNAITAGEELAQAEKLVQRNQEIVAARLQLASSALQKDNVGVQDIEQRIEKIKVLQQSYSGLNTVANQISDILGAGITDDAQRLSELNTVIQSLEGNTQNWSAGAQKAFETFKQAIASSGGELGKVQAAFQNLEKATEGMGNSYQKAVNSVRGYLTSLAQAEDLTAAERQAIENLVQGFDKLIQVNGKLIIAQENSANAAKNTKQSYESLEDYLKSVGNTAITTQTKIVTFAQTLTTTKMIIDQVRGALEILGDDTKSVGEKTLTVVSTVGMMLPMIISTTKALHEWGAASILAGNNAVTSAIATLSSKIAEKLGWDAASTSVWGYVTAILAVAGPIGIAIGVVWGLTKAVTALMEHLDSKKPLSLEDQLRNLNSQLDTLEEKSREVKDEIKGINSAFDEYNTVRASLDDCTEGTSLWYEALRKVQEQSMEMLSTYPILAKILNDPLKYFGDDFDVASLYDEHGLLNMELLTQRALELSSVEYNVGQLGTGITRGQAQSTQRAIDENATIDSVVPEVSNERTVLPYLGDTTFDSSGNGYILVNAQADGSATALESSAWEEWQENNFGEVVHNFGGDRYNSSGLLENVVQAAMQYGISNGIESIDEAIIQYLNLSENKPLASILTMGIYGGGTANITDWENIAVDGGTTNFIDNLKTAGYITGEAEAYYTGQVSSGVQEIKNAPAQEFQRLANSWIGDRKDQYGLDEQAYLQQILPHLMAGYDWETDTSDQAFLNYKDFLDLYSDEEIDNYSWNDREEQEDGSWLIPSVEEGEEGLIITPGELAAQQAWTSDPDFVEQAFFGPAMEFWDDLSLSLRKVATTGDFSALTGEERTALLQNENTSADLERINEVLGTSLTTDSITEGWKDGVWDERLTQAQNEVIDNLGTGIAEEVRRWGEDNDITQLFTNGVLDLSVMENPEVEAMLDSRSTGAEKYLGLGSNMFDLTEAYNKILEGEVLTQEELDLITTYTDLTREAFRETVDGWVMIGEATENVLTSAVQDTEAISKAVDGIKSIGESTDLDWDNLTADQKTILDYLGYEESILAQLTEKERERAELEYQAILNGEKALELTDAQTAAWLGTIQSWEQFNQTGMAWASVPEDIQETILSNIAKNDGYNLEDLAPYTSDGKIDTQSEYQRAIRGQQTTTGLNTLLGFGEDFKTLDEAMAKGLDLTANEETLSALQELAKALTLLTGLDISTDWLMGDGNWELVQGLFSGQAGGMQNLMDSAYLSGIRGSEQNAYNGTYYYSGAASDADEWLQYTYGAGPAGSLATAPVSAQYTMSQLNLENQSFDVGKGMWESNKEYLTAWATDRDNVNKWLQESGYLEANGTTLTEKGATIAEDLDGLYALVDQSILNGAVALDISSGKYNVAVQRAYNRIIGEDTGVKDNYGITRYEYDTEADQTALVDVLASGYSTAGAFGLNYFEKMAKAATDAGIDIQTFSAMLSNVDWTSPESVAQFRAQLEAMGVTLEGDFGNAIDQVTVAANAAAKALVTMAEAANEYSQKTSMADKLRSGESLTPEEYQAMEDIYGEEEARQMMTMDAMGQYHLAEGYSPETVASHIESSATAGYQAINQEASAVMSDYNSGYMNSVWTSEDKNTLNYAVNHADELNGRGVELTPEQIDAFTIASQEGTTYTGMQAALKNPEVFGADFDWNALFTALASIAEKEQEESGEAIADAEERIPRENEEQTFSDEMTRLNLDKEEVEGLSETLQELAENSKEAELGGEGLSEELIDNEKAAKEVAKELKRYDRALESVEENQEKWTKALKSGNPVDMAEAVGEMEEAYTDLLDIDMGVLSQDFLQNADNLELMKQAANGSEEAYEQLQEIAAKDILTQVGIDKSQFDVDKANIEAEIFALTGMELDDIEVGAKLNKGNFLQGLSDIVNAAGMTADQATAYLGSMGIDAKVVEHPVTTEETVGYNLTATTGVKSQPYTLAPTEPGGTPQTGTATYPTVTYESTPVTVTKETGATSLEVTSANKSSGGGFKYQNSSNGGGSGSRGRRGGGGGGRRGGGGGSRAPQGTKKKDSDKERYHTITNVLEDLTDAFDKVSKASDRAFGKARVKLLQEQQKELKKLATAQQDYLDEINQYLQQDLSNLDQVSDYVGFDVELDSNGTITNFDAIQDAMWADYNSHVNEQGEVIDMDEEAWEAYTEEWERIMGLIEQYEETQDLRKEALQQLQDYINQIYDLELEEITYTVEINIEASESTLEFLDYMLKKVEDDAWSAAEAIANMGIQAQEFLEESDEYKEGIAGILNNHTEDITDSEGNVLQAAQLTEEDVAGFMAGDPDAIAKVTALGEQGAFTAEEVESLKEYYSNLLKVNESLLELRESVYETVTNAFLQFNEEMDKMIEKLDHLANVTQHYRNIVDIVGKENLGVSNALLESVGQAGVEQSINRVEASRVKKETIEAEIARAEEALENARANGLDEDVKYWEETLETMNESLNEAEEEFLSSWEEALTAANEQFELAVTNAIETLSDALAGPLAGSLEELQENFDMQSEIAERYLPDYEKIYELNKLNRDITNSIDETSNIKAKQELADLQAEINALEEEGVQVSEYQMENLRRRYELKLAEIALSEAQNAKSQVQMTRDADGGWSYVYTADEDKVAEAEQNYEDRLFAIQQANDEYIQAMQENMIQLELDYKQKVEEIMLDETLSAEERMQRLNEVTEYYKGKMDYYGGELDLVLGENKRLYEEDWSAYSEATGYKISTDQNYVDSFEETALAIGTGFTTMEDFQQNFNDAIGDPETGGLLYDVNNAYTNWEANVEAAMQAAGTSVETFAEDMATQTLAVLEESENLTEEMENLGEDIINTFDGIVDEAELWANTWSNIIDETIANNEALVESFQAVLDAWSAATPDEEPEEEPQQEEEQPTAPEEEDEQEEEDDGAIGQITIKKGYQYWGYTSPKGGAKNQVRVVNKDRQERTYRFTQMDTSTSRKRVYIPSEKLWVTSYDPDGPNRIKVEKFDTGGYTGDWGSEGKMAMLHEKEIVLNQDDTVNLLNAVEMLRNIAEIIDLNAYSSAGFGSNVLSASSVNSNGILEQNVHITAEFPNATDKNEIYAAFGEIVNLASQYANRK